VALVLVCVTHVVLTFMSLTMANRLALGRQGLREEEEILLFSLSWGKVVAVIAGVMFCLLFLKAVGRCYQNDKLVKGAEACLVFLLVSTLAVATATRVPVLFVMGPGGGPTSFPREKTWYAVFIALLILANAVWFLKLLVQARRVIQTAALVKVRKE
jgi:hypothetical protein